MPVIGKLDEEKLELRSRFGKVSIKIKVATTGRPVEMPRHQPRLESAEKLNRQTGQHEASAHQQEKPNPFHETYVLFNLAWLASPASDNVWLEACEPAKNKDQARSEKLA